MYETQDYSRLLGTPGFSDALLNDHLTLYAGYVKNSNSLIKLLDDTEPGTQEYSELQRRLGWEWNGMRLHELYFGNVSPKPCPLSEGVLRSKIESVYGDMETWKKNFIAVGAMRGIGWAVLAYDRVSEELFNLWINEHDSGHLAGTTPLLVMDVFEHAYLRDYGIKRADYIDAFVKAIDWNAVEGRL